jgi:hypothetical protein
MLWEMLGEVMAVECLQCAIGQHESCWIPDEFMRCCCPDGMFNESDSSTLTLSSLIGPPANIERMTGIKETQGRGGQYKDADAVTDKESTGRKRAAKMFPITPNMPCEWSGLKLAGGGVVPIVGCIKEAGNLAKDIHHGPDKSTLSNFVGNVHRICAHCHNKFHAINDKYYDPVRPTGLGYYPKPEYVCYEHLPFVYATIDELAQNEIAWLQHDAEDFLKRLAKRELDKLRVVQR